MRDRRWWFIPSDRADAWLSILAGSLLLIMTMVWAAKSTIQVPGAEAVGTVLAAGLLANGILGLVVSALTAPQRVVATAPATAAPRNDRYAVAPGVRSSAPVRACRSMSD